MHDGDCQYYAQVQDHQSQHATPNHKGQRWAGALIVVVAALIAAFAYHCHDESCARGFTSGR